MESVLCLKNHDSMPDTVLYTVYATILYLFVWVF